MPSNKKQIKKCNKNNNKKKKNKNKQKPKKKKKDEKKDYVPSIRQVQYQPSGSLFIYLFFNLKSRHCSVEDWRLFSPVHRSLTSLLNYASITDRLLMTLSVTTLRQEKLSRRSGYVTACRQIASALQASKHLFISQCFIYSRRRQMSSSKKRHPSE